MKLALVLLCLIVLIAYILSSLSKQQKEAARRSDEAAIQRRAAEIRLANEAADRAARERMLQIAEAQASAKAAEAANPSPAAISTRLVDFSNKPGAMSARIDTSAFEQELSSIPPVEIVVSTSKVRRHMIENMREIKFTNITRSTNLAKIFPLVVLDTETTGFDPRNNDIIEISAIKFGSGFTPISSYSSLLRPRGKIHKNAAAVNHITDDMVKDCPSFQQVADSFAEYISGCNILGHNLIFDLRFLYAGGLSLPDRIKYYDTLDLAKKTLVVKGQKIYNHREKVYSTATAYDVENLKLVTLCNHYGIYRETSHRALSDCLATAKVFEKLIDDKTS